MKIKEKNMPLIAVVVISCVMLLPFLGLTDFNTKGEPREAVVALSMLKSGDWILPVNNGMDIPYKPPFFHYCIALVSLLTGSVDEYTSRLPSALALIGMTIGCFVFYKRRRNAQQALMGALLLLTSFEVHRAGVNCRVDMVLTACVVGAMLLFYRWWERGSKGFPLLAVLCMSGAVLTKGPVGFVLPCFVMWVFTLIRGGRFWRTTLTYGGFALLSLILPLIWYVAAWHEGGQHFLDLIYEENIGRMTGSMSYESHTHSFPYNFFTLSTGWAPWTLLLLFSLFSKPWKKSAAASASAEAASASEASAASSAKSASSTKSSLPGGLKGTLMRWQIRLMQVPPVMLFTWLGFLLVLLFYCFPSSKRSVYLLPCYPFMAMIIAEYVDWLWRTGRRGAMRAYVCLIGVLVLTLTAVFACVRMGLVPDTIFHGKHADANIAMLHALRDMPIGILEFLLCFLPAAAAVDAMQMVLRKRTRNDGRRFRYALLAPVILLMTALDGLYQPPVLNSKSLRPMAQMIAETFPGEKIYQHLEARMAHFFGADFYLGDTMDQFEKPVYEERADGSIVKKTVLPEKGVLIIPTTDFEELSKRHPEYRFQLVKTTKERVSEVKGTVDFYRFSRLQ